MASNFDPEKLFCDVSFGGIASTYSSGRVAGLAGGPIAYRSRAKQVIVAMPATTART